MCMAYYIHDYNNILFASDLWKNENFGCLSIFRLNMTYLKPVNLDILRFVHALYTHIYIRMPYSIILNTMCPFGIYTYIQV